MIYGIQAAQPDSGGGVGGNPYPDALATADFVLGAYWMSGSQVTAASMIDKPDLISASGLQIQDLTTGGVVFIIGALRDLLFTANYTIVFEWSDTDTAGNRTPISIDESSTAGGTDHLYVFCDATMVGFYDQPDPGANRQAEKTGLGSMPATRRIAATRTNAKISLSVDGTAVITDTVATSTPSLDVATLGGAHTDAYPGQFATMNGHIRRLIVYAEQADASLPALSTQ